MVFRGISEIKRYGHFQVYVLSLLSKEVYLRFLLKTVNMRPNRGISTILKYY